MASVAHGLSSPQQTLASERWGWRGHRLAGRVAVGCVVLLVGMTLVGLVAPAITGWDPYHQDIAHRLRPLGWLGHVLGTDQVGRDVLTRILVGARYSLTISLLAASGAAVVGVLLGLLAGYYRGVVGAALMRVAETQFSFPFIVIAIAIVAVFGASYVNLAVVLVLWGWVGFARVVYGQTLSVCQKEYVESARALGASDLRIMFRHVLPSVRSSAVIVWTFTMAQMLVAESSLSFLGLGLPPPLPSWGTMLADSRNLMFVAWWTAIFPGLAIVVGVLCMNLLGDTLRDLWDPRLRM